MKKIILPAVFFLALVALTSQARASWFGDLFTGPYHELETVSGEETDKMKISRDSAEVVLEKWGGEVSLTIKRRGDFGPSFKDLTSNVYSTKEKGGDESFLAEPVKGGIKIDILLYEKPSTNVFSFDVEGWEDFNFFYQPSLTKEKLSSSEIAKLDHCTDTDCYDKEGKVFLNRPEKIVGSYAIYHKTKKNNQYKTGKAFHIERPLIVDADGKETWAELTFDNGVLSVITPQEFLDTATYPVRIDPTFGYTTIGGTHDFSQATICNWHTSPEAGDIISISVYGGAFGSFDFRTAIYSDNGVPSATNLLAQSSGATTGFAPAGWEVNNISYTMTGSTIYWLCHWPIGANTSTRYDDGDPGEVTSEIVSSGESYPTWPDPHNGVFALARLHSKYATYTVSAPPASGTNTVLRFFNRIIKFTGGKIIIK